MTRTRRHVLVVGNGMAGARLAEEIRHRDPDATRFAVTVVGEEPHAAYNRVLLSTVVAGGITARDTRLKPDGWWAARHIEVVPGARVDLRRRRRLAPRSSAPMVPSGSSTGTSSCSPPAARASSHRPRGCMPGRPVPVPAG